MKIIIFFALFCFPMLAQGASVRRKQCSTRFNQVMIQRKVMGRIVDEPRYLPECESDGNTWKLAQCSHEGSGSCFCVDPETGIPLEETRTYTESKHSLNCDGEASAEQQVQEYSSLTQQGEIADSPLGYELIRNEDDSFKAYQSDENDVFCVDTITGSEIPETRFKIEDFVPLQESVCQAYSDIWHEYLDWIETTNSIVGQVENNNHREWYGFVRDNANDELIRFWQASLHPEGHPEKIEKEIVEPTPESTVETNNIFYPDANFDLEAFLQSLDEIETRHESGLSMESGEYLPENNNESSLPEGTAFQDTLELDGLRKSS